MRITYACTACGSTVTVNDAETKPSLVCSRCGAVTEMATDAIAWSGPGGEPAEVGVGEPRLRQASLDSLDLAQQLGNVLLERLHVFQGREARQPIGEAALNLSEHLRYRMACVPRAKVGRQLDARTREAVDMREGHRQDVSLCRQRVLGTRRSCEAALDGERLLGTRRASEQYIHRILIDVAAGRPRAAPTVPIASAAPAPALARTSRLRMTTLAACKPQAQDQLRTVGLIVLRARLSRRDIVGPSAPEIATHRFAADSVLPKSKSRLMAMTTSIGVRV